MSLRVNQIIRAFKEMNVKYTGSRSIKHTKEGFDEIVSLVREMEKKLETEVCVVYEATGVYHRVLKKVLEDNNIKQFIINPLLSAKTRKNDSLRSPKTDKLDPKSIAKHITAIVFITVINQKRYIMN